MLTKSVARLVATRMTLSGDQEAEDICRRGLLMCERFPTSFHPEIEETANDSLRRLLGRREKQAKNETLRCLANRGGA